MNAVNLVNNVNDFDNILWSHICLLLHFCFVGKLVCKDDLHYWANFISIAASFCLLLSTPVSMIAKNAAAAKQLSLL